MHKKQICNQNIKFKHVRNTFLLHKIRRFATYKYGHKIGSSNLIPNYWMQQRYWILIWLICTKENITYISSRRDIREVKPVNRNVVIKKWNFAVRVIRSQLNVIAGDCVPWEQSQIKIAANIGTVCLHALVEESGNYCAQLANRYTQIKR